MSLDPIAVAEGLVDAAHACDTEQPALRARLMQGAAVILRQYNEIKRLKMPPEDPNIPAFLKPQAD